MNNLIEALKIIKSECKKYRSCKECPLSNLSNNCAVNSTRPDLWQVMDAPKAFIKVFGE